MAFRLHIPHKHPGKVQVQIRIIKRCKSNISRRKKKAVGEERMQSDGEKYGQMRGEAAGWTGLFDWQVRGANPQSSAAPGGQPGSIPLTSGRRCLLTGRVHAPARSFHSSLPRERSHAASSTEKPSCIMYKKTGGKQRRRHLRELLPLWDSERPPPAPLHAHTHTHVLQH